MTGLLSAKRAIAKGEIVKAVTVNATTADGYTVLELRVFGIRRDRGNYYGLDGNGRWWPIQSVAISIQSVSAETQSPTSP